jgi:hypothetical protein
MFHVIYRSGAEYCRQHLKDNTTCCTLNFMRRVVRTVIQTKYCNSREDDRQDGVPIWACGGGNDLLILVTLFKVILFFRLVS